MKKIPFILKFSSLLLLFFIFIFNFSNCKKDKDINVTITVKYLLNKTDSSKVAVNALVKLFVDTSKLSNKAKTNIIDTIKGITDASGQFHITFKNPAILDVTAQKDNFFGQTIIKMEIGKDENKSILIH